MINHTAVISAQLDMPDYKQVNVFPMNELWNGKPHLSLGCCSGPTKEETYIYDIDARKQITLPGFQCVGPITYNGKEMEKEWPGNYVASLKEYSWKCPIIAGMCGDNIRNKPRLVFKYNENFALFRIRKGVFKNLCLQNFEYAGQQLTMFT